MTLITAFDSARQVLGIGKGWTSPIQYLNAIAQGFPVATLDRISNLVAPDDATFKYRIVPKSSLQRLINQPGGGKAKHLTTAYSEQVARVAQVWGAAIQVWGDAEEARRFIKEPHAMLEGRTPLEVALTADYGVKLVEDILGRLKYGSAA